MKLDTQNWIVFYIRFLVIVTKQGKTAKNAVQTKFLHEFQKIFQKLKIR